MKTFFKIFFGIDMCVIIAFIIYYFVNKNFYDGIVGTEAALMISAIGYVIFTYYP